MATTTSLLITHIESSQAQKEVTANEAFDDFDAAIAGTLSKSVAGGTDVTLTDEEQRNAVLTLTGLLTGNINVIVAARSKRWLVINNTTGSFTLTVKTSAGTGVIVPQGKRVMLYCDATNVMVAELPAGQNTLAPGDTVAVDWSLAPVAKITLDRATTVFTFSGATAGQRCILKLKQDGTGGRLITLPASVRYGTDIASITLTITLNKMDFIGFIYDADDSKYDLVSFVKGF